MRWRDVLCRDGLTIVACRMHRMRWWEVWWMCRNSHSTTGPLLSAMPSCRWRESNLRRGQLGWPLQNKVQVDDFDGNSCLYRAHISLGRRTLVAANRNAVFTIDYWFLCTGVELRVQIKGKSLAGICSWSSACAAVGRKPSRIFCPNPYWYWTVPISKFPKLPCVAKLETKLVMILPRIKADHDNYTHFNHIKRKLEACYIYLHHILHVFTKI